MLLHGLSSNHTTWLTLYGNARRPRHPRASRRTCADTVFPTNQNGKRGTSSPFSLRISIASPCRNSCKKSTWWDTHLEDMSPSRMPRHIPRSLRSLALVSANFMNPLHYGPFSPFAPALATFLDGIAWLSYPQGHEPYHYFEHGKSTGYLNSTYQRIFHHAVLGEFLDACPDATP